MQKEFKDLLENAYYDVLTSRVNEIDEVLSIPYGAADFIIK